MILVYGDDSADEKRERVAAVAAVIGPEETWERLEPQWVARNNNMPFHARDCESDRGDYNGNSHEHNKAQYKDLALMLAASELVGLASMGAKAAQFNAFTTAGNPSVPITGTATAPVPPAGLTITVRRRVPETPRRVWL